MSCCRCVVPFLASSWLCLLLLDGAVLISGALPRSGTVRSPSGSGLERHPGLGITGGTERNDTQIGVPDNAAARLPHSTEPGEERERRYAQPERTTPFVIVDGNRLSLKEALKNGHPERLECGLEVGGSPVLLELEKNRSIPFNMFHPTHCYYHGSVRNFPQSRLALSTCSGLRGVIILSANQSYTVEPEKQEKGIHVLYPTQELKAPSGGCGVTHSPVTPTEPWPHLHRLKRDILTETKYIELVLVVDHREYLAYEKDNKTIINRMLDLANQVDWFYRPLNVRVALLGLEIWSDEDKILIDKSPTDTLNRFLEWRTRQLLPRLHHDNAQLIMGGSFDGTTVGMASQSSMCSRDRSGGVNVDHLVSVLGVASTVAHELGHNLGMSHDTADRHCQCQNEPRLGGCIMEPSTGFMPGQLFSSCSARDLSVSLLHGAGMCLFNMPEPQRLLGGQRCGNLYVEPGEECDCGLTDECEDPCCNATTCRLVPGAQCSSDGICCENCKLRAAGSVCREPLSECDLPEHCSGDSPYCPPNVFLQNGQPCQQGASYCYSGVCNNLTSQCQVLWGLNSTQAPDVCFRSVNKQGNKYGNCGQMPNGSYIPCPKADVHCGKIQCQGGNDRPLLGSNAEIITTKVLLNRSELTCRGTFFNLGDDVSDPGMVTPGTACGPGKACLNQRCQDVAVFGVEECQKKCNGHGVCNSNRNCHCDAGWAPPDCRHRGYGGSVDSGPTQASIDSNSSRLALLIFFFLVLPLVVVCLVLLYRRCRWQDLCLGRSPFHKATNRQHNRVVRETRVRFLDVTTEEDGDQEQRTPAAECSSTQSGEQAQPLRYQWMQNTDIPLTPPANKVLSRPAPPNKPLPPDPMPRPAQSAGHRPPPPNKPLPPDPVPTDGQPAAQRPAPPNKPLPPDPVLKDGQTCAPAKPPPPQKPLPADPPSRPVSGVPLQHGPSVSSVPSYGLHVAVVPARRAPPPPVRNSHPSTVQPPPAV
nr:PREDICTED: disintegrin and metalloproteinase domain-containing protein 15-like [Lepisosteus oculatus]